MIDTLTGGLKQLAKRRNVEVIQARGFFENSTTLRLDRDRQAGAKSETLEFEHCILASGSRPMKIPAFDLPTPRVMDSTAALDLPDIPESLLVVGGGYIGLEMGTVYAELGTKVSVVELTDGLLPGADRDLVKPLHARLGKAVCRDPFENQSRFARRQERLDRSEFRGGRRQRARGPNDSAACWFPSAGGRIATGWGWRIRRSKSIAADSVVTDDQQRTADPHILAIGDVAGEPMLAHKASHQGKVAVEALHGGPAVFEPQAIPGGRVHRSGNRLGRPDRTAGQSREARIRSGPLSLGRQRTGPIARPHRGT